MITLSNDSRIQSVLAPYASDFETAAETTDDPVDTDIFLALAALARGEAVPEPVARRILCRAEEH